MHLFLQVALSIIGSGLLLVGKKNQNSRMMIYGGLIILISYFV